MTRRSKHAVAHDAAIRAGTAAVGAFGIVVLALALDRAPPLTGMAIALGSWASGYAMGTAAALTRGQRSRGEAKKEGEATP